MSDLPIIMSPMMVRALLAGHKTMTRRINAQWRKVEAGDRLWVRESWTTDAPDLETLRRSHEDVLGGEYHPYYFATASEADIATLPKWRPSIHMPKWASRITLLVAETRSERLQQITDADARAEGVRKRNDDDPYIIKVSDVMAITGSTPRIVFMRLWQMLHGSGSWDANPEVAVISFVALKRNIIDLGTA